MLTRLTSQFRPRDGYDVAIVGAGVAGITLALSLARAGRSVFLAEGGSFEYDDRSQDIYRGRVVGDPYYDLSDVRLRYLGGTSGHWGGICRPLDPWDFKPKAASAATGWPIGIQDLAPYEPGARTMLKLAPFRPDTPLAGTANLRRLSWNRSDPVRFGEAYRADLTRVRAIDGVVDCNLVGLDWSDGRVSGARFRNWDGVSLAVKAKTTVLACGGLENARILLGENAARRDSVGNQGGAVGRYWMDHPLYQAGELVIFDRRRIPPDLPGSPTEWGPTAALLERARILNATATLHPQPGAAKALVHDLLCRAPDLGAKVMEAMGKSLFCDGGSLLVQWEQEPTRDSHVALDWGQRDAFGRPRIVLNLHKTPLDRRTIATVATEVAGYLARQNLGRVRLKPWLSRPHEPWPDDYTVAAVHLIGGTRMAASPATGVVDRDGKVFGSRNLFVAGSSVFPSGGFANPTYTLTQLSLRLAAHLNGLLAPGR